MLSGMGLEKAKSLLTVTEGNSFLDLPLDVMNGSLLKWIEIALARQLLGEQGLQSRCPRPKRPSRPFLVQHALIVLS